MLSQGQLHSVEKGGHYREYYLVNLGYVYDDFGSEREIALVDHRYNLLMTLDSLLGVTEEARRCGKDTGGSCWAEGEPNDRDEARVRSSL